MKKNYLAPDIQTDIIMFEERFLASTWPSSQDLVTDPEVDPWS